MTPKTTTVPLTIPPTQQTATSTQTNQATTIVPRMLVTHEDYLSHQTTPSAVTKHIRTQDFVAYEWS